MGNIARLFALTLALNIIRYSVGGAIEGATVMEPMHAVMPFYPEVFDNNFTAADFSISLVYNFIMWFVATGVFHLMHPSLRGSMIVRSLKSYLIMCLFFCSVGAVYMNHYVEALKPFYAWSMVSSVIVFSVVGVSNGFLYPWFFRQR